MIRPDPSREDAQSALGELGSLSFAGQSLQSLLQRIADLAARVLPAPPTTSVTVLTKGRPHTIAAADPMAGDLDETQYRLGDGPCVAAARTGRPAEIPDTAAESRWPELAGQAAAIGFSGVLSVPLPAREQVSGGLNVYLRGAGNEAARSLARQFASSAVVPVSNMYLYGRALERAEHLQSALHSRAVIDQAKGILMERRKLTADQAFRTLAETSMEANTKLRVVAERLVRTGELRPG